jgi:quinolinate synthase
LLDRIALRAELADHYDLMPSTDIAEANAGLYARMERVVSPPE